MPVAAKNGTDIITKIVPIRPPHLAWNTPDPQCHLGPGFDGSAENPPLKMLRGCLGPSSIVSTEAPRAATGRDPKGSSH